MLKKQIKNLLTYLLRKGYISDIINATGSFSDEPYFPYYIAQLHPDLKFYNRNGWPFTPTGNSWNNSELALFKCLMETLERTSQFNFDYNSIIFDTEQNISLPHIDITIYFKNVPSKHSFIKLINSNSFGWIKGVNISKNYSGLIPAQLIFPNYHQYIYYEKNIDEPLLVSPRKTSHGLAGGIDHESTLLRAIYEVVEREARTIYIALKQKNHGMDIKSIKSKKVYEFLGILNKYRFKVYLFNIIHDLGIPVIMTVLVDQSGVGPLVNTGFKAGLKIEETIIGSIEDAFYQRYFQKFDLIKNPTEFGIHKKMQILGNTFDKATFVHNKIYNRLKFQLKIPFKNQIPIITSDFISNNVSAKEELTFVINKLKQKRFEIWYTSLFDTLKDIFIYKVVIPGLQPPTREEPLKNYFQDRLYNNQKYYKLSKYYDS